MFGFSRRKEKHLSYDRDREKPVIRASICNGEQVAGFMEKTGGSFSEVMKISTPEDLEEFRKMYGIPDDEEIEKVY
jgi:hypothetical protein